MAFGHSVRECILRYQNDFLFLYDYIRDIRVRVWSRDRVIPTQVARSPTNHLEMRSARVVRLERRVVIGFPIVFGLLNFVRAAGVMHVRAYITIRAVYLRVYRGTRGSVGTYNNIPLAYISPLNRFPL